MAPLNEKITDNSAFEIQERVRHRKVKTGCITCRARRVKCDETRPKCLRCIKYGAECGGYLLGRSKDSSNSNKIVRQDRVLLPRPQFAQQCLTFSTVTLFNNESEKRYFNLFSNHIAATIFPYFKCDIWVRIIRQACVTHSSIRYAAIAIGALGKICEIARLCKNVETGERVVMDVERVVGSELRLQKTSSQDLEMQAYEHHRQALNHYDKAIRSMRNDVENGNQDLRTSLIICIMINCFEHIHGNHKSAAIQAQAGLGMLHEFQSRVRRNGLHPQGYSSPCPDKIEDFLVQSFGRVEIQSMSVFDPRPQHVHITLKDEGKEIIASMPSSLQKLEEARNYLDLITRRIMHFNGSIHVPRVTPSAPGIMPYPSPILNMLPQSGNPNHNPIPWIELKIPLSQARNIITSKELNEEKRELLEDIEMWTEASSDLLLSATLRDPMDAISALTLRITALKSKITISSSLFLNESAYDGLHDEFHQIVEHASQLMALRKAQRLIVKTPENYDFSPVHINFSFDQALIPSLYIVMIKCRHAPIRHKALNLLRANPCREGVWDSAASSGLGAWVISLEEDAAQRFLSNHSSSSSYPSPESSPAASFEMDALNYQQMTSHTDSSFANTDIKDYTYTDIPEEIRVRGAQMRFDLLERRAFLQCTQIDLNTKQFVRKKGLYIW